MLHHRLYLVVDGAAVASLHLLDDALCLGVVARGLAAKHVTTHLAIAETHGEVGVGVVGQFLFHAHLGVAEILLLQVDGVGILEVRLQYLGADVHELLAILVSGVFEELLAVEHNLLAALHEDGIVPQPVYILACVASEAVGDGLVEGGQLVGSHILAVVVYQRSHHVAVERFIPLGAIVLEYIVLLLLGCGGIDGGGVAGYAHGAAVELGGAAEGLAPDGEHACSVETLGVELGELVHVELAFEVSRPLLVVDNAVFKVGFLADNAHRVDALVHAERVLPVVGALRVLGVILDAHGFVGAHVANHHLLLHTTYLCAGSIVGVAHLTYTV